MRRKGVASALEIGRAAVAGESWARRAPACGIEAVGLGIVVTLSRRDAIMATSGNMFRLVSPAS